MGGMVALRHRLTYYPPEFQCILCGIWRGRKAIYLLWIRHPLFLYVLTIQDFVLMKYILLTVKWLTILCSRLQICAFRRGNQVNRSSWFTGQWWRRKIPLHCNGPRTIPILGCRNTTHLCFYYQLLWFLLHSKSSGKEKDGDRTITNSAFSWRTGWIGTTTKKTLVDCLHTLRRIPDRCRQTMRLRLLRFDVNFLTEDNLAHRLILARNESSGLHWIACIRHLISSNQSLYKFCTAYQKQRSEP